MGLSDMLKGAATIALDEIERRGSQSALGDTPSGSLQSILDKLQRSGLEDAVKSWIDRNSQNVPVSADQIRQALGDEHVRALAGSLGLPVDALLESLAKHLPEAAAQQSTPPAN